MKLKSIEIKGFKSFYQKTEIEFPNGIVSIVGPNGSGKSNILDAFRWVLGEQSAKNLRGDKMEDVIFSGTARHNQSNSCEVEVVFDNQDGGLDLDFSEISIKRKAFRSGESSYFINGKQARLKEIKELFLDSGIGKEGYSIISQGKIDEIVNSTSSQRRKLLEEASGIARFRFRKEESEKKIENSKANLERLEDIFKEIERQMEPLSIQRTKALQYLELREELKQADVLLMLKEYDEVHLNHEKDMQSHIQIKDKIAGIDEELEKNKESINEYEENNEKQRLLIQTLEQDKNRLNLDKNNYHNVITRHNEMIEIKREQLQKSAAFQQKQSDMLDILNETIESNHQIQEELSKQFHAKSKEEEWMAKQIEQLTEGLQSVDTNIESYTRSNRQLTEEIHKNELKIQFLSDNIQREKIKFEESNISIHRTREKLDALYEQKSHHEKTVSEMEKKADESGNTLLQLQQKRDTLEEQRADLKKKLDNKNQLQREAYLKYQMYSSMEKDMEGINKSVKSILSNKALEGIVDMVSHVISTEQKYEKAVETALGAALQHIITKDSESAKKAVEYLKKSGNGRATFLPMDAIKGNVLTLDNVLLASDVVHCDDVFRPIVESLLGRTIIIDTMDAAIRAAKQYQYKYRIVTLDGEIFNVGGSITGGHYYKSNNLLSRKRIIEENDRQVKMLQSQIDELAEQSEEQKLSLIQLSKKISEEELQQKEIQKLLQQERLQLGDIKNRITYLNNTLESLLDENRGSTNQQQENHQVIEETKNILKELEEERTENRYILEDFQEERKKLSEEISVNTENRNSVKIALAELKNDREYRQKEIERLVAQLQEIQQQLAEEKNELRKVNEEIALSENQIAEAMMNLQLCEIEFDETVAEFEEAQEKLIQESKKYEKISVLKANLENERMRFVEEKFRLESKLDKVHILCDKIIERLKDEYDLTLEDARRLGLTGNTGKEKISVLRRKIQDLGNINLDSIEDYNVLYERYETYQVQIEDLQTSITELESIIEKLEKDMTRDFMNSFDEISKTFGNVFSKMFGGGEGKLVLNNATDVLNSEIEIFAQPPGKKLKSISVMSGGEKALMGIALLFAIQMTKPAPFCILDEIDAALDDANISRFNVFLKQMSDHIQFVTITHRRGTMENSDYIYGVTMQDKGVSKLVSLKFEDAQEYIEQ